MNKQIKDNIKPFLSVVVPAYNEEHNIRTGALYAMNDYLSEQNYTWELIVVDDGSKDKTAEMAENFSRKHKNITILREPHRGKGGAVIAGILKATGRIVVFDDIDQATPIDQLEKMLPKFSEGYDVVIGSRRGREGAPFVRQVMAWGFSTLRNIVLQLPFKDTQCGFKGFTNEASRKIFERLKVFKDSELVNGASVSAGFDLEILYIARKLGLKVCEVPVVWHHKEGTKVNPIKDSWEGLRDLIKVRINASLNRYKTK